MYFAWTLISQSFLILRSKGCLSCLKRTQQNSLSYLLVLEDIHVDKGLCMLLVTESIQRSAETLTKPHLFRSQINICSLRESEGIKQKNLGRWNLIT